MIKTLPNNQDSNIRILGKSWPKKKKMKVLANQDEQPVEFIAWDGDNHACSWRCKQRIICTCVFTYLWECMFRMISYPRLACTSGLSGSGITDMGHQRNQKSSWTIMKQTKVKSKVSFYLISRIEGHIEFREDNILQYM